MGNYNELPVYMATYDLLLEMLRFTKNIQQGLQIYRRRKPEKKIRRRKGKAEHAPQENNRNKRVAGRPSCLRILWRRFSKTTSTNIAVTVPSVKLRRLALLPAQRASGESRCEQLPTSPGKRNKSRAEKENKS